MKTTRREPIGGPPDVSKTFRLGSLSNHISRAAAKQDPPDNWPPASPDDAVPDEAGERLLEEPPLTNVAQNYDRDKFWPGVEQCLRIIKDAHPDKIEQTFRNQAREAVKLARRCDLEESTVYELRIAGERRGLTENFVEQEISQAREFPGPTPEPEQPLLTIEEGQSEVIPFQTASAFEGVEVPRRRWFVPGRIPLRAVTILSGDGASGKTTIFLQLCDAGVRGADWLGATIDEPGPAMFITAEEDRDEIHRRLAAITQHRGHSFSALEAFHFLCLTGEESQLCGVTRDGLVRPTPLFNKIESTAKALKPRLIGIEAAADVYGGDENNRGQVRQFIQLLRRLALAADAAVVLIQHPSVMGMAEGQGRSGSTGWRNSARSQLYFASLKHNDDEPEGDLRELRVVKSNYGRSGERVTVRWDRGVFVMAGAIGSIERAAAEAEVDALFLTLLERTTAQGRGVGPNNGRNYAPAIFEGMPEAGNVKARAFAQAMERLLSAGRIKVETSGPPSRPTSRLVRT